MNYCVHEDELLPHNCLGQQTKLDQLVAKKAASSKSTWKVTVSLILFLIVCCVVFIFCRDHLEEFLSWLDKLPRWQSGLIFVVLFTIVSLPGMFGYLILNVAAGYMYGFWLGVVIIFVSVTVGTIIAFILIRGCLSGRIERYLSTDEEGDAYLYKIRRIIEGKSGVKVIALSRFTPMPHGLQNGIFALTNISLVKFTFATCIGLLPTQILNTYFGTTLRNIKDVVSNDGESYMIFTFQLLISVVLMIFVTRMARTEINKDLECADRDMESGDGYKKGHTRSKSASAILMSKQKIINQPSQFR